MCYLVGVVIYNVTQKRKRKPRIHYRLSSRVGVPDRYKNIILANARVSFFQAPEKGIISDRNIRFETS